MHKIPTSTCNDHHTYGEHTFVIRFGCNITESDCGAKNKEFEKNMQISIFHVNSLFKLENNT